jgi:hypothetical protein
MMEQTTLILDREASIRDREALAHFVNEMDVSASAAARQMSVTACVT